jgi:hypothetical protein
MDVASRYCCSIVVACIDPDIAVIQTSVDFDSAGAVVHLPSIAESFLQPLSRQKHHLFWLLLLALHYG